MLFNPPAMIKFDETEPIHATPRSHMIALTISQDAPSAVATT